MNTHTSATATATATATTTTTTTTTLTKANLQTILTCLNNDTRRLNALLEKSRSEKDSDIISKIKQSQHEAREVVKKMLNLI